MSRYLQKKLIYNKAMDSEIGWRKKLELERELDDLLDKKLDECGDLSTMAELMGWNLSNYEGLSSISHKDIATCLEVRAWYLGIGDIFKEDEIPDFDHFGETYKKLYIKSHIENPINFYRSSDWKVDPVIKIEPEIKMISPTENGAQFVGNFSSHDYSYQNRLFVGINPYASQSDIEAGIRQILIDHRKKQQKNFPIHKKGNFEKITQRLSKEEVIEKMIIPALDLMILQEHGYLFSSRFPLSSYGKRKRVIDLVFNSYKRPSREKDWESFAISCCLPSYTNWLKAVSK